MKNILYASILLFNIHALSFSQNIHPLPTDSTISNLISTIQGVIFENGELIDIARERGFPCLKADGDIPTFIQYTRSENDKRQVIEACHKAQLIRFTIQNETDIELATTIDFGILKQLPQLKYVVFYVSPSIYKQQNSNKQQEQIEKKLAGLIGKQLEGSNLQFFYKIPRNNG